jgi:hypothetical protein
VKLVHNVSGLSDAPGRRTESSIDDYFSGLTKAVAVRTSVATPIEFYTSGD